ncbi:MAG: hypothetical protein J6A53_05375 [Clostridia bacterium]|nr:hypothetical protein [Clostridia bacterium]
MKRFKIFILYLCSFAVSISPLLTYFIVNRDRYICTRYDALKLFSGGLIIAFMLLLKVLKKLKIPSGVFLFSLLTVLAYLLKPIISDLMVLSFLALVGELGDLVIQAIISREKRKLQAKETASAVEDAIVKRIGRV